MALKAQAIPRFVQIWAHLMETSKLHIIAPLVEEFTDGGNGGESISIA